RGLRPRGARPPGTSCRTGRCASWSESGDLPALRRACIGDAIVQAAQAPLPEFERFGPQAIAAPMRRARRLLAVLAGEPRPPLLEPAAVFDRPALRRGPCADAGAQRARVVVGA